MDENIRAQVQTEAQKKTGSKLLKGATILAVAGILSKILGAIFRIPLTNLIGAEGMAYYGAAYPVYSYFVILATAGFPVAISRMVSERYAIRDYRNAHKTYKVSVVLMSSIGAVSFLICFFGAGAIADFMGNPGAKASILTLSPALLIAPVVASYRGYFQGQQDMLPTGVSEVVEQFVRVAVGLSLSFILIKKSVEFASAGATFGAAAGLIASMILLTVIYLRRSNLRKERYAESIIREESSKSIVKELVRVAIPITIGSTILPMNMIIDSVIIMNRLQATGWSYKDSKTLYGLISGFCDPLTSFPNIFIDAIAMSMLPAITAAFVLRNKHNLEHNIYTSVKTMMVIIVPCAVGMTVLAKPILHLLYPMRIEEADMAVINLQIQAMAIIAMALMRNFSTALQAINKMYLPVINLCIGGLSKIVVTFVLVGIPALNINGAAIGSASCFVITAILNYIAMKKYSGVSVNFISVLVKPALAATIMGIVVALTYLGVFKLLASNSIATLVSIILGMIVYFVMVFVLNAIERDEILMLPGGSKLVKITDKLHLTKEDYHAKH